MAREVRFTLTAARQIETALDEIAAQSPQGARNVRARLLDVLALLQMYPHAGRITSKPGIRRIVVSPYPYLIDYRAADNQIVVRRFRHAARKPVS